MSDDQHFDIAIIGGGIIGSATAYFLARTGRAGRIAVIEPDPTYERASSPAANGGIRRLFSLPENIAMGTFGLEFYRDFPEAMAVDGEPQPISFRQQGYMFLSDTGGHDIMEENHATQVAHGVRAEVLSPAEVKSRFPSINVDDLALAVYSPEDAWLDPHAALMGFRKKARSLGVTYVKDRVVRWSRDGAVARDVTLDDGGTITADVFVLAAGGWSGEVGELIGLDVPVSPLSRESYFFKTNVEIEDIPFLKSESDLAFRPEGTGFAGGMPDWSRGPGWDWELSPDRFESVVWPAVANRIPAMQTLKLERAWVGHYDNNTLDHSAIIGRWDDGAGAGADNVYMGIGYSGHGIMHAPASGLALSELILDDAYSTMDLTPFGYARVPANEPYAERGIV